LSRNRTTGEQEYKRVTALTAQYRDKLIELRIEGEPEPLRPAVDHPFWVLRGPSQQAAWIVADSMRVGDLVLDLNGDWHKVLFVRPFDGLAGGAPQLFRTLTTPQRRVPHPSRLLRRVGSHTFRALRCVGRYNLYPTDNCFAYNYPHQAHTDSWSKVRKKGQIGGQKLNTPPPPLTKAPSGRGSKLNKRL